MSKKKKVVILTCMIALLVTTAVLNFILSSNVAGADDAVAPTASYFTEVRNTRNTSKKTSNFLKSTRFSRPKMPT